MYRKPWVECEFTFDEFIVNSGKNIVESIGYSVVQFLIGQIVLSSVIQNLEQMRIEILIRIGVSDSEINIGFVIQRIVIICFYISFIGFQKPFLIDILSKLSVNISG